jgi:hypothetical protein
VLKAGRADRSGLACYRLATRLLYYSVAIFELNKVGTGTRLRFTQIGVPPSRYSGHYRGWIETYWTPMKEIFATGSISERTRARVKTDKTQRIERGQFRRKVTKAA